MKLKTIKRVIWTAILIQSGALATGLVVGIAPAYISFLIILTIFQLIVIGAIAVWED
jgi:hypothetical protein